MHFGTTSREFTRTCKQLCEICNILAVYYLKKEDINKKDFDNLLLKPNNNINDYNFFVPLIQKNRKDLEDIINELIANSCLKNEMILADIIYKLQNK